ncbi:MAG: hypothetical protein ISS67_04495 [Desulfobacterales bacterium]|nr:hypothetical protein [Desulfobacterales bacterium]MBL7207763.1 hypothetical protein [Desulfobacterales bacterium]
MKLRHNKRLNTDWEKPGGFSQPVSRAERYEGKVMADRHEKREITIFKAFAKVSSLQIIIDSIKKNTPPKPDIQCEVKGLGFLSFELIEIIDRNPGHYD